MKNFIKAHPYLSCTGLAVATDALNSCTILVSQNKFTTVNFIGCSIGSLVYMTLPSLLITAIDQYGHQNLFDNKPLQYGLTAVESVLSTCLMYALNNSKKTFLEEVKNGFNELINPKEIGMKCGTAASLIQSLGFKYILDSANEQSEVETSMVDIEDILVIEM